MLFNRGPKTYKNHMCSIPLGVHLIVLGFLCLKTQESPKVAPRAQSRPKKPHDRLKTIEGRPAQSRSLFTFQQFCQNRMHGFQNALCQNVHSVSTE